MSDDSRVDGPPQVRDSAIGALPPRSQLAAFARGYRVVLSIPATLLFATGLGFGALARDTGFSIGHTAFISATVFAAPNQLVLFDQLARNEALLPVAFAVALAGLRLLPMTVTIAPLLKGARSRPLLEVLGVHFIAVSPWIESQRRLPVLPPELRLATHLGFGFAYWSVFLAGTILGFVLAGSVPASVSAMLLFVTPIYFLLSLVSTARVRMDYLAIALGCGLAPILYVALPGFDLLATGLLGGTLAFLLTRRRG